jgi:hypothetical protein
LLGLAVSTQASPGANRKPEAFSRRAVRWFVAIDQSKARLAFVLLDVEADPSAVGQLEMATGSHQLTRVGIRLTLQEQRSDASLKGCNLGSLCGFGLGGKLRQLSYIALDAISKLNLVPWSGLSAHDLSNLDAEIG